MIRVLHVVNSMNCGGAENLIMNYYRLIDKSKIQFDFLVNSQDKCYFDDEIEKMGGKIYRCTRYNVINAIQYKKLLNEFFASHPEISIVHGHMGSCSHIYLKIAKKYGCYCIAHAHSTKSQLSVKNILFKFFSYRTRGVADYYFGCGESALEHRYGKRISSNKNISGILPNAIDVNKYLPNPSVRKTVSEELCVSDSTVLIGNIGRFSEVKNHLFLIDVFNELCQLSSDYKLILLGDGDLHDKIYAKASSYGIEDRIIFAGIRDDVFRVLQRIDLIVMPSLYEGLPVSAIEAQASKTQCFFSDQVPKEASLCNANMFISIKDDSKKWAKIIHENIVDTSKYDYSNIALYDVNKSILSLSDFYLNATESN